ncbi:Extracellular ribonuclease precursor [Metamycoplasma arthritidis]|uniref:Membrane nuclease n=1 Tax=Metamycoplasma arthritidis (strain 158L3-1) TaxID=243272 RepID=B3PNI9_META1|nr:endonuclease [Metamycoplasma arthritidis]ACF07591.1 membrane nuclease [Metamycoplasma arthritidis 158L3-1]VEU79099.1 Extracellular ribonuclease precursor [Metamycoplasma arthritidis]
MKIRKKLLGLLLATPMMISFPLIVSCGPIKPSSSQSDQQNSKQSNQQYSNQSNYYASLDGLSNKKLFNKLFEVQKSHLQSWNYQELITKIYPDAFVDKYYEKDGTVLDIYGENPSGKDPFNFRHGQYRDVGNAEGKGMNREHLVPQSWFSKMTPMRNDAHHVWPTDKKVNAVHGNFPYGTVSKAKYVSKNGTKIGVSEEDGQDVCEVIDEFKGDVARAYLYFAFTYKDQTLTANRVAERFFNEDNSIKKSFLATMLKWHMQDPISQFDIDRNNAIAKHQGIRNPFIDYPELVEAIYGNNKTFVFQNKGILIGKE